MKVTVSSVWFGTFQGTGTKGGSDVENAFFGRPHPPCSSRCAPAGMLQQVCSSHSNFLPTAKPSVCLSVCLAITRVAGTTSPVKPCTVFNYFVPWGNPLKAPRELFRIINFDAHRICCNPKLIKNAFAITQTSSPLSTFPDNPDPTSLGLANRGRSKSPRLAATQSER